MENNEKSKVVAAFKGEDVEQPLAESPINQPDQKTPGYAWVIWIVTFLVSFAAPLGQFKLVSIPLYFILVPGISPDGCFGLDATGFGWLMTAVSIIGIILAFPGAFICRKIGLRNTIAIATLGVIIGGLIPVLMPGNSIPAIFVGRVIEGMGIGLVGVAAPTLITLWFPPKTRGLALGLWCLWVPLAITFNSIVCPPIAGAFGWRGVFWFVIIFAVVALILFWIFFKVPEGEGASYNVEGGFAECVALLKNKNIWFMGIAFLVFIAGQTGIVNTYLPNFLQASPDAGAGAGFGWSEAKAGFGLAVVTGIGIVANPLGGAFTQALPDKFKRLTPVIVSILYMFTFFLLFQNHSTGLLWLGIILMGICAGLGGGGMRPLAPAIMCSSAMAATMGMSVLQFMQCVGNCFSPIYGALIDGGASYFSACLYTMLPMAIVMFIVSLFISVGPKKDKK